VVDLILDTAGQKGTGKWTAIAALDLGQPLTLIGEAVFARCLSALKDERVAAAKTLPAPARAFNGDRGAGRRSAPGALRLQDRLLRAGLPAHARGGEGIRLEPELRRHRADVARRLHHPLRFLGDIKKAFDKRNPTWSTCCSTRSSATPCVKAAQAAWRGGGRGGEARHPDAGHQRALAYYDGYRCARLPANLLQAQRDYFGAHTYERVDKPRGEFFHTNWTGRGGSSTSPRTR
jgi:6-phosphogluconate dehydrogenase